jgi:hypothetical protein
MGRRESLVLYKSFIPAGAGEGIEGDMVCKCRAEIIYSYFIYKKIQ